ncbi:competence protein ComK [Scopulibacillus cellulosilyticus]|uniref:Competence protein ComK n=1 Tax=Scopulibacillus cellulosilyticus TaxID=2665665 RepID=A0ABW2Q068_9BACL
MMQVENYIVKPETMALFPMNGPYGERWTIVIETTQIIVVPQLHTEIIDRSCAEFGTSYEGGKSGTIALMGYKTMTPICLCAELGMYFLPLSSPENHYCIWLSHTHIKDWKQKDKESITVRFINYQVIDLPISKNAFDLKVFRTAQYRHRIQETVAEYRVVREPMTDRNVVDLNKSVIKMEDGGYRLRE